MHAKENRMIYIGKLCKAPTLLTHFVDKKEQTCDYENMIVFHLRLNCTKTP